MASRYEDKAVAAREALEELITASDAHPNEKRVMHAALEELWLVLVDDAPVYPSPLGAFHDAQRRPR